MYNNLQASIATLNLRQALVTAREFSALAWEFECRKKFTMMSGGGRAEAEKNRYQGIQSRVISSRPLSGGIKCYVNSSSGLHSFPPLDKESPLG